MLPTSYNLRSRATGFTLVELLVVMGIILILMALFIAGFKHWSNSSKMQTTAVRMETLNSWMAELQTEAPQTYQSLFINTAASSYPPRYTDSTWFGQVGKDSVAGRQQAINYLWDAWGTVPSPTSSSLTTMATISQSGGTYYPATGIMTFLIKQPNIASSLKGLPSGAYEPDVPTITSGTAPPEPVLLDGWGNPIIFAPAPGISYPGGTSVVAPDGHPFWVSAGPDGDFTTPSDNLYSFNQQP